MKIKFLYVLCFALFFATASYAQFNQAELFAQIGQSQKNYEEQAKIGFPKAEVVPEIGWDNKALAKKMANAWLKTLPKKASFTILDYGITSRGWEYDRSITGAVINRYVHFYVVVKNKETGSVSCTKLISGKQNKDSDPIEIKFGGDSAKKIKDWE